MFDKRTKREMMIVKHGIRGLIKCVLAGITAIVILCVVLAGYSLTPIHIHNPQGNTDYIWSPNAPWCKMTEGISFGKFDANGYNNTEVVQDPDILVLGSSHTEAVNVFQSEGFAALLGQKFQGKYTTYNMGISGHFFLKICKYLPRNIEMNPSAKYIIIETSDVSFSREDVDSLINGTVEFTPSNGTGLIGTLQKLPFLRIVYNQLTGGLMDMLLPEKSQPAAAPAAVTEARLPEEAVYDILFTYIQDVMQDSEAHLIIMYHPTGKLLEDGSVSFAQDDAAVSMFSRKCQQYSFSFVDMTQPFAQMYETEQKLPHGFITGKIGFGHINKYGHAKIADELARCIAALEEE